MDLAKIKAITDYPTPTNVKTLQSFLGLVNFSLQFVPQLATVTQPLRMLLKKGTQFIWSTACINNFDEIKKLIKEVATLAFPDFSRTFRVQTDASDVGIGVRNVIRSVLLGHNRVVRLSTENEDVGECTGC